MTTRALLEAVADRLSDAVRMYGEARTTMQSVASVAHDAALDIRRIASSLEGQTNAVEDGEGFFHLDNLATVCQREGFSDRDYERLSYALEVTRTAQSKDKPA